MLFLCFLTLCLGILLHWIYSQDLFTFFWIFYKHYHVVCDYLLLHFFPLQILISYSSFSWLIALAMTSGKMLNRNGYRSHDCLCQSLEKSIQHFINKSNASCSLFFFLVDTLYQNKDNHLYSWFAKGFLIFIMMDIRFYWMHSLYLLVNCMILFLLFI